MGNLKDWADKQSKFIKLRDGESIEGLYQDYKVSVNQFDAEKETVHYRMKVNVAGETLTKAFQTGSAVAARFFDSIKPGTRVKITRHGDGPSTKYEFKTVDDGILARSPNADDSEVPF